MQFDKWNISLLVLAILWFLSCKHFNFQLDQHCNRQVRHIVKIFEIICYLQRKCINQCFMYLVKFDWPGTELFVGHFPTTRRTTFPRDWAVQGRDENGNFRNLVSSLFYEYLYILVLTSIMLSQGFVKGEEFCIRHCDFYFS